MKNSFRVENDEIVFRRANVNDNLEEIAALIYETDPYIYPFWFNNSLKKAQKFLSKLIIQKGHLYNIDNLYIAYDKTSNHVIGILCAIDKSVPLDFDWTKYKKINHNYKSISMMKKNIQTKFPKNTLGYFKDGEGVRFFFFLMNIIF